MYFLAQPYFESDAPQIVYSSDTAEINWPIINLDSVTYILIEVCVSDSSNCKPAVNITSPDVQPYIIPLPEGDSDSYDITFTFFDRLDVVYKQVHKDTITGRYS